MLAMVIVQWAGTDIQVSAREEPRIRVFLIGSEPSKGSMGPCMIDENRWLCSNGEFVFDLVRVPGHARGIYILSHPIRSERSEEKRQVVQMRLTCERRVCVSPRSTVLPAT